MGLKINSDNLESKTQKHELQRILQFPWIPLGLAMAQ